MSGRWSEEELLHLLLDRGEGSLPRRTAELRAARADPEAARVLARYDVLLASLRAGTDRRAEWPATRERALVQRILGATTRTRPGWRGDLALAAGFVGERLRASAALRALAAGIVLSASLSTVFAWLAVREGPREPLRIGIEPPPPGTEALPPAAPVAGELELPLPASGELTDAERRAWDVENVLRRDRWILAHAAPVEPLSAAAPDDPLPVRLLRARATGLAGREWPAWVDAEATLAEAAGLDRVLLVEVLLDRLVLTGADSPLVSRALHRLSREGEAREAGDPVAALARRALARASAYGRGAPDGVPGLAPRPLDAEWRELLARAVPPALAGDPAVRAWR
ncbi:MAG: hypothetical protein AB1726_18695 [Planctomycetota bacterium]